MRELCERRKKERDAVARLPAKKINVEWARNWLLFIEGRAGVPGPIPDQDDRNQLWLYFKTIY
jgi:hypothetical protein